MDMMKALVTTSVGYPEKHIMGEMEMVTIPIPEPGDEEVRIKVAYATICGSDVKHLKGGLGSLEAIIRASLPRRMGHEISGVIDKVGPKAAELGWKVGDRVTGNFNQYCNSCHYCRTGREAFCENNILHMDAMSEYVVWHMSQMYHLPDSVDMLDAVLTEPTSVALNAVESAHVSFGGKVAVFGAGGIGILCAMLAKKRGASHVTVFEPMAEKRAFALEMGADAAIDPSAPGAEEEAMKYTDGYGYDSIMECSGAPSATKMALRILGIDSHVVYFAMYNSEYELNVNLFEAMYRRQSHLHGMFNSSDNFERTVRMMPLVNVRPLIQRVYSLDEYDKAFVDQMSGKFAKVAFRIHPEGLEEER